jgi:predicted nucleic acid-binding protein
MADRMVVDANVAGKWFLKDARESDVDLADEILVALLAGDIELHAPRIIRYELSGLLTKACLTRDPHNKTPRVRGDQASAFIREFFRLPIRIRAATEAEAVEALQLAVTYSKGHYDMTYLRLAEKLDCQWCTADAKVLKANRKGFPAHRVRLLSALRPAEPD